MHKRSKLLIVGFLSVGLIGSAIAYHKHGRWHEDKTRHIQEKLIRKLDLDNTQSTALGQLTNTMLETQKAFKTQKIIDLNQILSLLETEKLDQQKAMELVRNRLSAMEDHAEQMIVSASGFTDSLTMEQRVKLKQLLSKRIEHGKHHQHNHGEMGRDS